MKVKNYLPYCTKIVLQEAAPKVFRVYLLSYLFIILLIIL